jgi:hypothetical protein
MQLCRPLLTGLNPKPQNPSPQKRKTLFLNPKPQKKIRSPEHALKQGLPLAEPPPEFNKEEQSHRGLVKAEQFLTIPVLLPI